MPTGPWSTATRSKLARAKAEREAKWPPGTNRYLSVYVPEVLHTKAATRQRDAGQKRKRAFLAAVGEGKTIVEACREVGITQGTYETWRNGDEEWQAALDYMRANKPDSLVEKQSFAHFRQRYFGFDSYYHHLAIIDAIESAEDMSVTLILVHPEAGKTTTVVDWLCQQLAQDPNLRVGYVSESEGFAKKQLGRIQSRMTDATIAPLYIKTFGPFKDEQRDGKPWAATHFTVAKASHDEADFSLEARGITSQVYGSRFDIIIFDDIQSRKNLNQTESILERIRQDFLSRPGKTGRVVIIGTRVDVGDVYERMIDEGIVDRLVQLPATNPVEVVCPKALENCNLGHANCCGEHWPDGSVIPHEDPLMPEMWDCHSLARRRRQVGNVTWLRSYQQRPQAAGSATFSEDMIEAAKDSFRKIGEHDGGTVILGLDPALGGQCALSAACMHPDKFEVLDMQTDIGLSRVEQIMLRVQNFAELYKPKYLVVETDTLQKGLARDERLRELAAQHGFLVIEHRTAGQKSDETWGVSMMAGSFSRGEFRIPWADSYAQRRMAILVEELAAWRPQIATRNLRQDTVMAMWFPWSYWMRTKQNLKPGAGKSFNRTGWPIRTRLPALSRRTA